jgi:hypothetical protein
MKIYELIFSDDSKGCFRVSLVKDPAVEATLVKFSTEKPDQPLFFANEEKRVIYAVAMRPNKLIFRKEVNGEPANVFYTAETIERLQQNYFKQQGNVGTNVNHEDENTSGIFPFESFIVKDDGLYTKETIGLETIKGDWVMAFKIDNDEVWEECKKGNLDGLSIEAYLGYKETSINFKNQNRMNWKNFFKVMFGADPAEIAPGYWAQDSNEGTVVLDKDGNPAANAEFEIDGKAIKTDADGKILKAEEMADPPAMTLEEAQAKIADLEIKLADAEAKATKAEGDKTKADEDLQTMKTEKAAADLAITKMTSEKATEIKAAELAAVAKFKAENTPATPQKNVPGADVDLSTIPYEKMNNVQKMKFNRDKKS